jgi:hypothetical protein
MFLRCIILGHDDMPLKKTFGSSVVEYGCECSVCGRKKIAPGITEEMLDAEQARFLSDQSRLRKEAENWKAYLTATGISF